MLRPSHAYRFYARIKSGFRYQSRISCAIVGAGPSGFYTAGRLLDSPVGEHLKIDLFDHLPTPFGLSRYGVAPDHPEVKNCETQFQEFAEHPHVRFFGSVRIGDAESENEFDPITLRPEELDAMYNIVVYAYGASHKKRIRIPGSKSERAISARDFVMWYNGHPDADHHGEQYDLSNVKNVALVGQGNVALDIARILLKPVSELRKYDLPDYVIERLSKSNVKSISFIGRRGPLQLAASTKELREILSLPNVKVTMDKSLIAGSQQHLKNIGGRHRVRERQLKVLHDVEDNPSAEKCFDIQFFAKPHKFAFFDDDLSQMEGLVCEKTEYSEQGEDYEKWMVQGTKEFQLHPAEIAFYSIGYESVPIPGVPFDHNRRVVPNDAGRMLDGSGNVIPGHYATGWVSRGPTGILALTMFEAYQLADLIVEDIQAGNWEEKPDDIVQILQSRGRYVTWSGWKKIDELERSRGEEKGCVRQKLYTREDLLSVGAENAD